jgi:hypothetical protein
MPTAFIRLNALRMRIAANAKAKRELIARHGSHRAVHVRADRRRVRGHFPQVCVGGLIAYMVFIIGQLAWESKAGKYGAIWMFVGLGVGFIGFMAKGIIQRLLGIE